MGKRNLAAYAIAFIVMVIAYFAVLQIANELFKMMEK